MVAADRSGVFRILENAGNFTPENLERGYTLRNLLTLQSLDVIIKGLNGDAATQEATAEATAAS